MQVRCRADNRRVWTYQRQRLATQEVISLITTSHDHTPTSPVLTASLRYASVTKLIWYRRCNLVRLWKLALLCYDFKKKFPMFSLTARIKMIVRTKLVHLDPHTLWIQIIAYFRSEKFRIQDKVDNTQCCVVAVRSSKFLEFGGHLNNGIMIKTQRTSMQLLPFHLL